MGAGGHAPRTAARRRRRRRRRRARATARVRARAHTRARRAARARGRPAPPGAAPARRGALRQARPRPRRRPRCTGSARRLSEQRGRRRMGLVRTLLGARGGRRKQTACACTRAALRTTAPPKRGVAVGGGGAHVHQGAVCISARRRGVQCCIQTARCARAAPERPRGGRRRAGGWEGPPAAGARAHARARRRGSGCRHQVRGAPGSSRAGRKPGKARASGARCGADARAARATRRPVGGLFSARRACSVQGSVRGGHVSAERLLGVRGAGPCVRAGWRRAGCSRRAGGGVICLSLGPGPRRESKILEIM